MPENLPKKQPPKHSIRSLQYDLFKQFVTNDVSEVSNSVEIWESIPKYFFTPKQVEKLRTKTGHSDPYKWEYTHDSQLYTVKIHPALIEQSDGSYKAFFPSITEELVEEALKKIFTDYQYGLHNPNSQELESWVRFSLRLIYKELKARGKTRSIAEIKHAIEVMSFCIITVYSGKKEVWRGAILQDLVTVGREEYIADTDAHHIARLPLFLSRGINKLEYRQFNYKRLMSCNEQLTRWIYKRLINRYKQASHTNSYHFLFSDLRTSGLLQQARATDNRKKVISALDELSNKGILYNYETDERTESRKIIDVKYTVFPSSEFVSEQKAANKRSNENYMQAVNAGISVDN